MSIFEHQFAGANPQDVNTAIVSHENSLAANGGDSPAVRSRAIWSVTAESTVQTGQVSATMQQLDTKIADLDKRSITLGIEHSRA